MYASVLGKRQVALLILVAVFAVSARAAAETITWTGNEDGTSWALAGNWDLDRVPGTGDDVAIPDVVATSEVVYSASAGVTSVSSLASAEPVVLTGGTLSVTTTAAMTASAMVDGGTLLGGAWTFTGEGCAMFAGASVHSLLSGVTIHGELLLPADDTRIRIEDGTSFTTARLGGSRSSLGFAPGSSVPGDIVFEGAATSYRFVEMNGTSGALTIPEGVSLRTSPDFDGIVQIGPPYWYSGGQMTLVNDGLISAETSGRRITLGPADGFTNNGTISAQAGTVAIEGPFTNFADGALTGGTYDVTDTLQFADADIVTNAATVVLNGHSARIVDQSERDALANLASIATGAAFTITNSRVHTADGALDNAGAVTVALDCTLIVDGAYTQTAGHTTLSSGTLETGGIFIQGGELIGNGAIDGAIVNAGSVSPGFSAGTLEASASYTQESGGELAIELGDPVSDVEWDSLVVEYDVALAGTLSVTLVEDYEPPLGSSYIIITAGSVDGAFETTNLPTLVNGRCLHNAYTDTEVTLLVLSPAEIAGHPTSGPVCEGDPVAMTVMVTGSEPMSYHWQKNGEDIDSAVGATLEIDPVAPDDAGTYEVIVTNPCRSVTSDPAELTVIVPGPGDYDLDCDVDLDDLAGWSSCVTGPDAAPYSPGCGVFDFDSDSDVDLQDFGAYTGALEES